MKKLIHLSILTTLLLVGACKENEQHHNANIDTIEVVHELGTTQVKENPERVVVFDIGSLETLDQLGVKIVGIPKDFLPEHLQQYAQDSSIENVGSVKEANYEKINALNPDLIIISDRLQDAYKELSSIAPTIYMQVDYKDYLNSFEKNTLTLGKIFGKEKEAEEKVKQIKDKIQTEKDILSKDDKKALIVLYNNGKFSAYGKGSRFGFIHDVLGVQQATENLEVSTHGQPISNEFIEHKNPDYLFIVDRSAMINRVETNKKEIENALIQRTNAYKNGKIIYLNPQVWYVSGGGLTSTQMMVDEVKNALK
ncbi:siderophore ABC transporter substrate-binding protein [Weeksella virosa]|uniref:siderophore ABC transporter substrate-binding protein n=1 Tax=Weeksella virosa TaxID=1014 RepID=UPI002552D4D0|nr:siderophore ABC transporter substrate-binding protein [Weeksella virosa]MDK7674297.1 siderophore ABC transporter substrate-binding protein [Weeksella virosa]